MMANTKHRPKLAAINSQSVYFVLWINQDTYGKGLTAGEIRVKLEEEGLRLTSQHIGHVLVRLERMGYVASKARHGRTQIFLWQVSALAIDQGLVEVGDPITRSQIKTEVVKVPLWAVKDPHYATMSMDELRRRFGGEA